MRILTFIGFLFLGSSLALAQSAEDEVIRLKQSLGSEVLQSDIGHSEKAESENERVKAYWNMSVGTSFTYIKGYGSGMGFYAAPMYTLPLNNRWSVHGGFVVSNFTGLGSQMPGSEFQSSNSVSSLAVYAAASYRMSDRLILHGSGLKNLTSYPLTPMGPGLMDNLSLGATYKLGNNISIGASVHINQGHGYYQTPSFGGPSFGVPYLPLGW